MSGRGFRTQSILIATRSCFEWDLAYYLRDALTAENIRTEVFVYGECSSSAETGAALIQSVEETKPDILLGLKLDTVPPDALAQIRSSGVPVALWNPDCFSEQVPVWIEPLLAHVDLFFTTAKGMVDAYRAQSSASVKWLMEGVHLPAFPEAEGSEGLYSSEVAFLGNVFQPPVKDDAIALRRLRLLSKIGEKHDLRVWGPQSPDFDRHPDPLPFRTRRWPAYNEECVKICRASDIVLGINTINTVHLYFSNRTFLTLASGGFHLTSYVPGLETLFEDGRHLAWFKSDEECIAKIEHYLARPELRERIAAQGREYVRSRFSLARQARKLLELMEGVHAAA